MSAACVDPATPHTLEERWVVHCILWTYAYYLLGALYLLGPALAWLLAAHHVRRHGWRSLPLTAWAWIAGMLVMLVAVLVAHAEQSLGVAQAIKSSIGWAKGWALMALFIVIGFGRIRIEVLARALCWLGVQTLALFPLLVLARWLHLPGELYVSPLSMVGGPGPEYFAVELYGLNAESGAARWRLFAPWAPAVALLMCCYVVIALQETRAGLRAAGIAGMLLAILASGSRLGLLALPAVVLVTALWQRMDQPALYLWLSPVFLLGGLFAQTLADLADDLVHQFHGARADSSRVRAALARMAVHRWQTEAYWWGHGNVEPGPHLVEHMPIGSHHTWYGLLFVKGLVGLLALAVPMAMTLWMLFWRGRHSRAGRAAFGVALVLGFYTFSENLEMLAYLYWPALVALGIGLRTAHENARGQPHAATPTPPPALTFARTPTP